MAGYTLSDMKAFWKSPRQKKGTPRDRLEKNQGGVSYYLWNNRIAHYDPQKRTLMLSDAGWRTHTTKQRLNQLLGGIGGISQARGQWIFHSYGCGSKVAWPGRVLIRV